jgi:transcriptional regulator with XRE-family HTH domain
MKITEYGKLVRKARLDASITMLEMADAMGVAPSYLSALEVGRKKIPEAFVERVNDFFVGRGIKLEGLRTAAEVSNETVSIEGLSSGQQFLIAGLARQELSNDEVMKMQAFLRKLRS